GAVGFALAAPRLRSGERDDSAQLAELSRQILVALRERPAIPSPAAHDPAPAPAPRVEPLGQGVTRPDPDEAPAAPPVRPEVWEQRGDERFLRTALLDHEAYTKERRLLALEEQEWQRAQANVSTNPGHAATSAAAPPSALATFLGEARLARANYPEFEQIQ